jgi:hypothetical protein
VSDIEIKGGAGIFEAAVIAVVLDHIKTEEQARASAGNRADNRLNAWIRALDSSPEFVPPPASPS